MKKKKLLQPSASLNFSYCSATSPHWVDMYIVILSGIVNMDHEIVKCIYCNRGSSMSVSFNTVQYTALVFVSSVVRLEFYTYFSYETNYVCYYPCSRRPFQKSIQIAPYNNTNTNYISKQIKLCLAGFNSCSVLKVKPCFTFLIFWNNTFSTWSKYLIKPMPLFILMGPMNGKI